MDILQKQNYEINNLISRSGKFKMVDYQKALMEMVNKYRDISVDNGDFLITTTKSIEVIDGFQIMDVEFMLPLNHKISVEQPYTFKDTLSLTNALYLRVTDPTKLEENLRIVEQYMKDHNLQPITSAYFIQKKLQNEITVEIYVGVNPNIL